ncbi:MAG: glycosyltransferase family 2 protein [Candidatus Tectomicrobia bacterium]|uniref:Glycosyltransferase family 2 protein n=1 Tax=Tectimicrobiota bacterium TaxID=2528274 RepID=A0A932GSU1_UNCTE|nr:glycosyltransferase family 2 protein [Candidatus Tectomicrobia bacterium]
MAASWENRISKEGGSQPLCDLVIPVWNQLSYTRGCIESILRHTPELARLIVIDNGSTDGTGEYLQGISASLGEKLVLISNPTNLGFVRAVNQGLRASQAPYVCLLNNDTLVTEGWLSRMIAAAAARPQVGLVNPLGNVGGSWSEERWRKVQLRLARGGGKIEELEHCSGFCLLIKREVIEAVGFLDETFGMGNFEDNDYCERARRAGYLSVKVQDSWVHHFQNRSFDRIPDWGENISEQNRQRLHAKWPARPALVFVGVPAVPESFEAFVKLLQKAHAFARSRCRVAVVSGLPEPLRPETFWESLGLTPHANLKTYLVRPLSAGNLGNRFCFGLYALMRCRRLARKKRYQYVYLSREAAWLARFRRYLPLLVLYPWPDPLVSLPSPLTGGGQPACRPPVRVRTRTGARGAGRGEGGESSDRAPNALFLPETIGDPAKIWDPDLEGFLSRLQSAGGS